MPPEPIQVLLDEGVPLRLRAEFSAEFRVETVQYQGWAGLKNGELLGAAASRFDAFVTVDKRMRYQQNIGAFDIAVVVLDGPGTKFADLRPLLPRAEEVLRQIRPGVVFIVAA